ncbi:MAG: PAS domain-containing sensor histidine kinase [endosymbiont of Escarpia spicata]|uniref:histidine kinase n=1 Tax=endosymbiont of Escarpia spicata TaxID=2200908 RepID=A0A370DKR9_9GAMM|nr:MAG: PAS domain-containing sensor histidine kinase [endosymbiont of Escarpia spicata]
MTTTGSSPLRVIVIVTLAVMAAMTILISSSGIALRIAKQSAPLIDATMEVKYELSLYHLWFEELVQQDPTVDREQVWQHLNQARWYANAMLEGGENREGRFQALDDPIPRAMILKTLDHMDRFESVGLNRLETAQSSLADSGEDQRFDEVFAEVITIADEAETAVQQNMAVQVRQFERLVYILGAVVILIGLAGGTLFFLFERRRNTQYDLLLESREQLDREQKLLKEAQAFAHIGNWTLDAGTMKAVWSDEIFRIFGIDATDDVGPEFLSGLLHPEDRDPVLSSLQCAVEDGRAHDMEYRIARPDGEIRWINCLARQIQDESGKVLGLSGVTQDITKRKLDEFQMQESNERLSRLFEHTDAIAVQGCDKNRRIIYWNPASESLYGYSEDEAIGQQLEDLIIPDEMREQVISAIDAWVEEEKEIPSSELTLRRADGSQVEVFSSHVMFRNKYNEPEMYSIDVDLTELKQAEAKVRKGELVLNSVFQALPDLFFLMDKDGTIRDYRAQQTSALYVPPETFLGKRMQDVLPPPRAAQFNENKAMVNEHGGLATYEYSLEVPQGPRQYEARLSRLPDSPQFIAVVRDITGRKQAEVALKNSEERYRTIFEGAPEGVWLIGPDHQTLEVNQRLCEMLGYQTDEMIGRSPLDFADEENQKIFRTQMERIDTTSRRNYEVELRHSDGHNIPVYFNAITLHTDKGTTLAAVAFVTDLTGQKAAEQVLRRAQKMDAIGQLTGGIAHDFNNLLGIIIGNLDFLKRLVEDSDKSLKRVDSASKAALRAADLTRQLLGFSRKQSQETRPTDINQVIRDMESLIARSLTPEVEVELQLTDAPWLTHIDPGDLEDALLNLIINARDAMPQGGKLTIETANRQLDTAYTELNPTIAPGDYLQLAVSDNGSGIPVEIMEQIFDPFFTTKPPDKGTGLGLSMVYGFAQRSYGYVKAYSEAGIGTTIRLYLPRTIEAAKQAPQASTEEILPSQGHETILVVDDENDLLDLARDYLEEAGYRIYTATRGPEALAILKSKDDIKLLFSDVVMPGGMNGYELAEQANELNPGLKVLFTSGFTKKAAARNYQARVATNLLTKPYSRDDLMKRIRETLDGEES